MSRLPLFVLLLAPACTRGVVCEWPGSTPSDTALADTGSATALPTSTPDGTDPEPDAPSTSETTPPIDSAPAVDTAPVDTGTRAPCGGPGVAGPGFVHTIWPDDHTGDEATAQPKVDAHDGRDGDNSEFRRHNVARAHINYWYTSSFQDAGEPDPSGGQWVDYAPDFQVLGAGRYEIIAHYRQTENRAPYEALYKVQHRDGETVIGRDQRIGDDYESFSLGVYEMCPAGFLRVEDPGVNSITFNQVEFVWVGP